MSGLLEFGGDPDILRGGRELLTWIEAGGRMHRSPRLLTLRLRWAAYWFERFAALTSSRCATIALPTKVVFILGLWRSGSTVLHQDLAEASGWATPRTWQCFNPADFLLKPNPRERQVSRPMDHGIIGTFTPQEDEFAALLLGENSLYRAFIDPRRIDQVSELLGQWRTNEPTAAPPLSVRWENFLKAVSSLKSGPLLLKSPNHTFRLPWLAMRFPAARFIWLTRREDQLLESNQRMWLSMMQRYALWHARRHVLDAFLASALENHRELLDWARTTLADRLHVLSFNEVMNDRPQLVRRLIANLAY